MLNSVFCFAGIFVASNLYAQAVPNPASVSNPAAPPNSRFINTWIDPQSGRQYDRYQVEESYPVPRWKNEEVTERRWVAEWTQVPMRDTQTNFIPMVQYQWLPQVTRSWNPLVPPQTQWAWVPTTHYQPQHREVQQQLNVPNYVQRDVKVVVPRIVQETESRSRFVDVERIAPAPAATNMTAATAYQGPAALAMANRNTASPNYDVRTINTWYQSTPQANMYPYSPYAAVASNAARSPYGYSPTMPNVGGSGPAISMNPMQVAAYSSQSTSGGGYGSPAGNYYPPPTQGYPNQGMYPSMYPGYYTATRPAFQWPAWSNAEGPLLAQGLLRQNPSLGTAGTSSFGTIYPNSSYAATAGQPSMTAWLRPVSTPIYPQNNNSNWNNLGSVPVYRDPAETGLPATVLR